MVFSQLVTPVGYSEGLSYPYFAIWADYQPKAGENIKNVSVLRISNKKYLVLSYYCRMITESNVYVTSFDGLN